MKHLILILSILLIPSLTFAQSTKADRGIGIAIRSSVNSELPSARVVPCIQYLAGNHQLELGLGLTPVLREDQQVMSDEFSYQYFPNGTTNKFNGYLITSLSYVRRGVDTFSRPITTTCSWMVAMASCFMPAMESIWALM